MISDVRFGQKVKPRALLAEGAVFRGETAYVLVPPRRRGFGATVREFTKVGGRWRCDGLGRADLPQYAGLFDGHRHAAPAGVVLCDSLPAEPALEDSDG